MNDTPAFLASLRAEIATAPLAELPSIIGALVAMAVEAFARTAAPRDDTAPTEEKGDDGLLVDAEQAAKMLGVTSRWVRDHQADLPRVKLAGRVLRFSAKRIAAMVKRRSYG